MSDDNSNKKGSLARREGKTKTDFPKKDVQKGTKIEYEHSNDKEEAQQIALDHLTEHPKYYDEIVGLPAMEKKLDKLEKKSQDLSDEQKKAGNYKKEKRRILGFECSIENPAGSVRSGTSKDGKKWSNKIYYDYGYLKGTMGKDGDQLDVFINKNLDESKPVFIINQVDPKTRVFDEHKIMIGFDSKEDAKKAYLKNYEKGWQGVGNVEEMDPSSFKKWAREDKMTKKKLTKEDKKKVMEKVSVDAFYDELNKIAGRLSSSFHGLSDMRNRLLDSRKIIKKKLQIMIYKNNIDDKQ
jgi:inorganic pyrophosphatase